MAAKNYTVIVDLGAGWFRVVHVQDVGRTLPMPVVLAERITFDLIAETLCENDAGTIAQAIRRTL